MGKLRVQRRNRQYKGGREKVTLEAGSEHKAPEEGSKTVLEAEPETKRLGKKNVSLQELFYLSLIICLPQLILKNLLLQKGNFRTPDHHPTLGHLPLPRQTQGSVMSGS